MSKVVESSDSNYQKGDIIWGMSGWEEYSVVTTTETTLFKIDHDKDVPLSYYTGILGEFFTSQYTSFPSPNINI